MSKAPKTRGFTFEGPTMCSASMQATGRGNVPVVDRFRGKQVGGR